MARSQVFALIALVSLVPALASCSLRTAKTHGSNVGQHSGKAKIVCPAPHFIEECNDSGTCFCVCKDPESPDCPSTMYVPTPEEAAAKFKEAIEWKNAAFPYPPPGAFTQKK